MIEKRPENKPSNQTLLTHDEVARLFREAVADALEESRRKGVPIPVTVDGRDGYELPDGTFVDEDPWHGRKTAPEGWYERWGIEPPARREKPSPAPADGSESH